MLAAVGIVRELSSWEASATRDSVWMEFSGTLRWRVAKNVIRACIVWCAFGAWFVQVEHSLCWKKEVGAGAVGLFEAERAENGSHFWARDWG